VQLCKVCFYAALENEVHATILKHQLFSPGEVVALGASGGKDSTVLAHIMNELNKRHKFASESTTFHTTATCHSRAAVANCLLGCAFDKL
jgi:tRNA(Ile)-lysidine synthase TilS/MesJ